MTNTNVQGTLVPALPLTAAHRLALSLDFDQIEPDSFPYDGETLSAIEKLREWVAAGRKSGVFDEGASAFDLDTHFEEDTGFTYLTTQNGLSDFDVLVLQRILAEVGAPYVLYEYGVTCDKMRAGEFGGGALIIMPDRLCGMNTGQWAEEKLVELGLRRHASMSDSWEDPPGGPVLDMRYRQGTGDLYVRNKDGWWWFDGRVAEQWPTLQGTKISENEWKACPLGPP